MGSKPPIGLIAGLGNPGSEYVRTRHNAGFWFIDALADDNGARFKPEPRFKADIARVRLAGQSVWLVRPSTYMNESGQSVAGVAAYYKIPVEAVLVAHDELGLKCGTVRLKRGGGHAGHNGLRDISKHLGAEFVRARIGIDRPSSKHDVAAYVLTQPRKSEREAIDLAIDNLLGQLDTIVSGDITLADKALL